MGMAVFMVFIQSVDASCNRRSEDWIQNRGSVARTPRRTVIVIAIKLVPLSLAELWCVGRVVVHSS